MGMEALDMDLDTVIKAGKGSSKGRSSKGSGKGKSVSKGRIWGGARASARGKESLNGAGKKSLKSDAKLDMALEEVVQAEKGRGKGPSRTKGKSSGKGRSVGKGRERADSYDDRRDRGWGSPKGKSSSKGYYNGSSSKGRGSKGYSKGYDSERASRQWSQHDDWRVADDEDDDDDYRKPAGRDDGIRGLMRGTARPRGDSDGWGSGRASSALLGSVLGRGRAAGGASETWADRLGGSTGWTRVPQDRSETPPPRRRLASDRLGMAARATREAAREGRDREAPSRRTATSAREEKERAATRRKEREEPEPPRRRSAREEPAAPAPKRRKEETTKATASKRIKITNVAKELDEQDIKEAFEAETGKILECNLSKSTAYIVFAKAADAIKAVETFDRGELNGKQISVTID
eukprot:TRINITY_DN101013_c0_g1_i1.p1 TRINITY_DN101013_c0_g1~~TRINITY_DN101013_c0_g1_i1.p1  ORF type:complete len:407 (+),score=109.75 TRINITY_DN101013_c0_g1_i1:105-1325(+)